MPIKLCILIGYFVIIQAKFDETTVDHVIQQALKCHPSNPGLAVAVVKNGHVLMTKGYGVTDVVTKKPVTKQTVFSLASLTKAFTSTLLVDLLHDHGLNIYSDVADILKNDFQFSTQIRTEAADVRDLLSHTLGIPVHNYVHYDPHFSLQTLLPRVRYLKSIYPFRSSYVYNNLMYSVAAAVAEKLGHHTWEHLIQRELYNPLGMSHSTFISQFNLSHYDVAQGYTDDDYVANSIVPVPFDLHREWGKEKGGIGVMSNAEDMAKWLMFNLNGGKNSSHHQLIDKEVFQSIFYPRNVEHSPHINKFFGKPRVPVATTEHSYALGWRNGYYRELPILRHTGTITGYSSLNTLIPDMDIGIFTSMSGSDDNYIFRTLLHNYLADVALGVEPWLNETTICSFPSPWYQPSPPVIHHAIVKTFPFQRNAHSYAGTYRNNIHGDIKVTSQQHHLTLTYGVAKWTLYPQRTRDLFGGVGIGLMHKITDLEEVTFDVTSHSHVRSVQIPAFSSRDPPVFTKVGSSVPDAGVIG